MKNMTVSPDILPDVTQPSQFVLRMLADIAHDAGKVALSYWKKSAKDQVVRSKSDGSPVSDADLQTNAVITQRLRCKFPNIPIVSEEGDVPPEADLPARYWLVDPIDGTKSFLRGEPYFTVNIALVENGKAVLGVIDAPALGETFAGDCRLGAYKCCDDEVALQPIHASVVSLASGTLSAGSVRLVTGARSGHKAPPSWRPDWVGAHEAISSSYKFCRIAEGAADVFSGFGPTSLWDTAAGQALVEAAGGVMRTVHDGEFSYGADRERGAEPYENPSFIAYGDPKIHAQITALLASYRQKQCS